MNAFSIAAILLLSSLSGVHAQELTEDYLGKWMQVSSSAGHCANCTIDITSTFRALDIVANNGWNANVLMISNGARTIVEGRGRWGSTLAGRLRGEPFRIEIRLDDERLHLSMEMLNMDAKPRTVVVAFRRERQN